MQSSLPPLPHAAVRAFTKQHPAPVCQKRGLLTRASETLRDVTRALVKSHADALVRDHGRALGYAPTRLRHLLDVTVDVRDRVAAQTAARSAGSSTKLAATGASLEATNARNDLVEKLESLAGHDDEARRALAAARGDARDEPAVIASLHTLAAHGREWLARTDPESLALVESCYFDAGVADRAADALEKARSDGQEQGSAPRYNAALNGAEGRMVLEFAVLHGAVERARARGVSVDALEVGPALRRALLQDDAPAPAPDPADDNGEPTATSKDQPKPG